MAALIGKQPNLLEFLKGHGPNPTFTNDEYLNLSNQAVDEVRRLCSNLNLWNIHSSKDGIDVIF